VTACRLRGLALAPFFPSARRIAAATGRSVSAGRDDEHFDPELPRHRAWLAVLEQLVIHELQALKECGTLWVLRTAHPIAAGAAPVPKANHLNPYGHKATFCAARNTRPMVALGAEAPLEMALK
jgi:hypothetical protein